ALRGGVEAGLQVGPGGEPAAGPGDRDRPHALVVGGLLDGGAQVDPELLVPRVHRLGAIELDTQQGAVGGAAREGDGLRHVGAHATDSLEAWPAAPASASAPRSSARAGRSGTRRRSCSPAPTSTPSKPRAGSP